MLKKNVILMQMAIEIHSEKKTPCTPSKTLQAYSHSFCCFAVQAHNKKNWSQLEYHGHWSNCHGRALPMFGSRSGPKRVFVPQRATVKQSARPSRVREVVVFSNWRLQLLGF